MNHNEQLRNELDSYLEHPQARVEVPRRLLLMLRNRLDLLISLEFQLGTIQSFDRYYGGSE